MQNSKIKDIVITMDNGIITGVYCPHDEYVYEIHVLDTGEETIDSTTVKEYFEDVENHLGFLQNCY